MWHRGNQAKARDLYDFCAVADAEPAAIETAGPFFFRHGAAFLERLHARAALAKEEFDAIDAIGFHRSFDDCLTQAQSLITPWLSARPIS